MSNLILEPIRKCGGGRTGTLLSTYNEIVEKIGEPNVTDLDDPYKVKASWGFKDTSGTPHRESFIWCYRADDPKEVTRWSCDGSKDLLMQIFGEDKIRR
jgi:hypothetical protein